MGLPLNNQIPKNSTPQFQFFPFFFGIQCKYSGYPSKGGAERWSFSGPLSTFSHPKTCKDVKCVLKRLSLHYLQGHRYKNSNLEIKDFRKLVTHGIWVGWGRLKIDDSIHHNVRGIIDEETETKATFPKKCPKVSEAVWICDY